MSLPPKELLSQLRGRVQAVVQAGMQAPPREDGGASNVLTGGPEVEGLVESIEAVLEHDRHEGVTVWDWAQGLERVGDDGEWAAANIFDLKSLYFDGSRSSRTMGRRWIRHGLNTATLSASIALLLELPQNVTAAYYKNTSVVADAKLGQTLLSVLIPIGGIDLDAMRHGFDAAPPLVRFSVPLDCPGDEISEAPTQASNLPPLEITSVRREEGNGGGSNNNGSFQFSHNSSFESDARGVTTEHSPSSGGGKKLVRRRVVVKTKRKHHQRQPPHQQQQPSPTSDEAVPSPSGGTASTGAASADGERDAEASSEAKQSPPEKEGEDEAGRKSGEGGDAEDECGSNASIDSAEKEKIRKELEEWRVRRRQRVGSEFVFSAICDQAGDDGEKKDAKPEEKEDQKAEEEKECLKATDEEKAGLEAEEGKECLKAKEEEEEEIKKEEKEGLEAGEEEKEEEEEKGQRPEEEVKSEDKEDKGEEEAEDEKKEGPSPPLQPPPPSQSSSSVSSVEALLLHRLESHGEGGSPFWCTTAAPSPPYPAILRHLLSWERSLAEREAEISAREQRVVEQEEQLLLGQQQREKDEGKDEVEVLSDFVPEGGEQIPEVVGKFVIYHPSSEMRAAVHVDAVVLSSSSPSATWRLSDGKLIHDETGLVATSAPSGHHLILVTPEDPRSTQSCWQYIRDGLFESTSASYLVPLMSGGMLNHLVRDKKHHYKDATPLLLLPNDDRPPPEGTFVLEHVESGLGASILLSSLPSDVFKDLATRKRRGASPPGGGSAEEEEEEEELKKSSSFAWSQERPKQATRLAKHRMKLITEVKMKHPDYQEKEMRIAAQGKRCRGCLNALKKTYSPIFFSWRYDTVRFCWYLGEYYCSGCHDNSTFLPIPARILNLWDARPYPVSRDAYQYLKSIWDQPVACISAVNPLLFSKVSSLKQARDLRVQLTILYAIVVECPAFAEYVTTHPSFINESNLYYLKETELFSFTDLVSMHASQPAINSKPVSLSPVLKTLENLRNKMIEHVVQNCRERCYVKAAKECEGCAGSSGGDQPRIFEFEVQKVQTCPRCGRVYHKVCYQLQPCLHCFPRIT